MGLGTMPEANDDEASAVFAEINITPLTDIFLVLLIIFMVGASMAVDAASASGDRNGVRIELPEGSAQDLAPGRQDVVVAILADGRVLLSGEAVAQAELAGRLGAAHRDRPEAMLVLQADEGVAHGRVVAVMERAREAGFSSLAVATRGQ
ncbi:MAG: biopolymer transporter ExbD [Deltaproteobacteria bacterium]|nr:biopolymer transporter ExbD [Deltaproteobacteria bacterium]